MATWATDGSVSKRTSTALELLAKKPPTPTATSTTTAAITIHTFEDDGGGGCGTTGGRVAVARCSPGAFAAGILAGAAAAAAPDATAPDPEPGCSLGATAMVPAWVSTP